MNDTISKVKQMKEVIFFSKNERSFNLFRKCWMLAAREMGANISVCNRGVGAINLLRAIRRYFKSGNGKRVVFGFTEILIYIPFSKKTDIFVFTGLGRLLLQDGVLMKILKAYFSLFYRNQSVVVLNDDDRMFVARHFCTCPSLINGEGYFFENLKSIERCMHDGFHFAYVGRLLRSKGVDTILEAFSKLPPSGCRLSLYGDTDFGNLDSISNEEIKTISLKSHNEIVQHGYCDNVKKELLKVDVVISMSQREGLPFSVMDSIDSGCYIILSPVPGHLSFIGLPGIEFCDKENLGERLVQVLNEIVNLQAFDRIERVRQASHKFGHESVIKEISMLLMDH